MMTYRAAIRSHLSMSHVDRLYFSGNMSERDYAKFYRLWQWAGYPRDTPEVNHWYTVRGLESSRNRANRAARVVFSITNEAWRIDSHGYTVRAPLPATEYRF
jgi:hypothetical protein